MKTHPTVIAVLLLVMLGALPFVGRAIGATALGDILQISKAATVGTCDALREGGTLRQKGGVSEGYTKLCYCVSDGAASPAYQWCSAQFGAAAAVFTCLGGTATVCP